MKIIRSTDRLNQKFDMVIIGGGITGLAIAREASVRGISVCILEKKDFSWATSAATSKLIHGGLRYLENYEFDLVRESLRERRLLAGAATRLMKPLPIILPVYSFTKPGRFLLRMGLWIYDLLSFDRNRGTPRRNQVPMTSLRSAAEIRNMGFCLNDKELKGGFIFYDYQSLHPERLALSFLKSAVANGAVAINHMEVTSFTTADTENGKRITEVHAKDLLSDQSYSISGDLFVNATGPWMDLIIQKLKGAPVKRLNRSQGIHIMTRNVCNGNNILHRNKEGRHFFLLSWMGQSLIGPTDTPYNENPDELHAKRPDVLRLLADVNEALPDNNKLTEDDISAVIIGIRPLISTGEEGSGTYHASRKAEIYDHGKSGFPGLISVAGGKWTTSRYLGEQVVKAAAKTGFINNTNKLDTRFLPLAGSYSYGEDPDEMEKRIVSGYKDSFDEDILRHLYVMYGSEYETILDIAGGNSLLSSRLSSEPGPGHNEIFAQVVFAITHESALTLEDILNRRLSVGTEGLLDVKTLNDVARIAAQYLGWNNDKIISEVKNYQSSYPNISGLKE